MIKTHHWSLCPKSILWVLMGRMGTPMEILSLHESSDLRQGSMLTTCIASIMRSMNIDQHCIHCESLLIWSIQLAAVIWVFCILTKRPCVAAMLKYFAFLAFLAVSLRRCVALQRLAWCLDTYLPTKQRYFLVVLYLSYYRKDVHIINHFAMFDEFGPNWDVYQVP